MENGNNDHPSPADDQSQEGRKSGSQKRRTTDGSSSQTTRAKRNRYISIACNECKRRKIKCNGETPCHRCGNLSLECIYAPNCCSNGFRESDEYRHMTQQLQTLQEQVETLFSGLSALQQKYSSDVNQPRNSSVGPLDPQIAYQGQPSPEATSKQLRRQFSGPTSSAYDFDIANNSLQSMGINQPNYGSDDVATGQDHPMGNTSSSPVPNIPQQMVNPVKDPLVRLTQEEALRLCKIYDEEIATSAPMLDMDAITAKAKTMYSFLETMKRIGFLQKSVEQGESFGDDETLVLKMILATASTVENGGQSEIGRALFENVRRISNLQDRLGRPANVKNLQILAVTAQYYYHSDEEIQAYKFIGIAARGCFEMGLHRSDVLTKIFTSPDELKWVVRLFWVVYHLDRQWSFGTGMPFAMQDADIDPQLPEPDDGVPFLKLLVTHGRISSKVWTSVSGFENFNTDARKSEIGFLDYQIQQWQSSIPESLRYQPSDNYPEANNLSKRQRRLRLLLYLRTNQSRIQLYRPVLYSITSILENRGYAQTVVEIAKETVRTLSQVHQTSDLYRSPQASSNYFLISALGVLFLSVAHAPAEFSQQVREEFYLALDLIKGCSSRSYVTRRLWKTIRGLKDIVNQLGMAPGQAMGEANDPSSAAVAMADLAGHQVDDSSLFSGGHGMHSVASSPMNGQQMSYDLTNLFEHAGGYPGLMARQDGMISNGMIGSHNGLPPNMESISMASGNEEEFVRIMKECF